MGHAAAPGYVIRHDWLELRQFHNSPAGVLSQPMRSRAECLQADSLEEIDRRWNRQISRRIARAAPMELVGKRLDFCRWQPPPAQHRRPNAGLVLRRDVEKTRTKGGAEPFMAARGIEVAAELLDVQRRLGDGVRTIDHDRNAALASPPADFGDGKDDCGRRADVADDD